MSSVLFPAVPRPDFEPEYREFAEIQTPPGGGEEGRVAQLGDRWKVRFSYPAMDEAGALLFVALQTKVRAEGKTARVVIPVGGARPTGVTAYGSANSTLINAGADAASLEVGWFFSFEGEDRAYLHQITGFNGEVVQISPRLRDDLDGPLELVAPVIEGFLADTPTTWSVKRLRHGGVEFTVSENA